jgi:hypothetical protein
VRATSYSSNDIGGALAGESIGGVGAFPGLANETVIARPENRINQPTETQPPTLVERAASYLPAGVHERVAALHPYVRLLGWAMIYADVRPQSRPRWAQPPRPITTRSTRPRCRRPSLLVRARASASRASASSPVLSARRASRSPSRYVLRATSRNPSATRSRRTCPPRSRATSRAAPRTRRARHRTRHVASVVRGGPGAYLGERVGGAGALFGTVGETAVANLPDKRVGAERDAPDSNYATACNATMGAAAATVLARVGVDRGRPRPRAHAFRERAAPPGERALPAAQRALPAA